MVASSGSTKRYPQAAQNKARHFSDGGLRHPIRKPFLIVKRRFAVDGFENRKASKAESLVNLANSSGDDDNFTCATVLS
jgi:hypothetical protein